MDAKDVLRELTGVGEIPAAARILANRTRAKVAEPLFAWSDYNDSDPYSHPVSLDLLKEIGNACGIRRVEFGATLASEGELKPLEDGGFKASILRESHTSRARFTLAHEIGHTFFYDRGTKPPRRLCPYDRRVAFGEDLQRSAAVEEAFCNEFALELLLPEGVCSELLANVTKGLGPAEILASIERLHRRHRTSILGAFQRLDQANGIPADILVVVLRRKSHFRTHEDVSVRVCSFFPRPAQKWYLPPNRRAQSIGLRGANVLFEWWGRGSGRLPSDESKNRSGVFCINQMDDGQFAIYENEPMPRGHCRESVILHRRPSPDAPWRQIALEVPVMYRFYAINVAEYFCVALLDLSKVTLPSNTGVSLSRS